MYYVYVLFDENLDKFYIGYTNDLKRRIFEHRSGKIHTTFRMKNHKLVYYEACLSKKDAAKRERQLKTGFGRAYLRKRLANSILDL